MEQWEVTVAEEDLPDDGLLRRIAEGDREAQEILYRRYGAHIQRRISYLRRSQPWLSEEDAFNETFKQAREGAHTFETGRNALPWLLTILKNWSKQEAKRQRREFPVEAVPEPEPADMHASDPHELLNKTREIRELYRALARLNDEERSLINAVEFEGRSISEMAGKLGISTNALRVRLFRAKRRLSDFMRKE